MLMTCDSVKNHAYCFCNELKSSFILKFAGFILKGRWKPQWKIFSVIYMYVFFTLVHFLIAHLFYPMHLSTQKFHQLHVSRIPRQQAASRLFQHKNLIAIIYLDYLMFLLPCLLYFLQNNNAESFWIFSGLRLSLHECLYSLIFVC